MRGVWERGGEISFFTSKHPWGSADPLAAEWGGGVLGCLQRLKQHSVSEHFHHMTVFLSHGVIIPEGEQGPRESSCRMWTELSPARGGLVGTFYSPVLLLISGIPNPVVAKARTLVISQV
jgi:hypothetical protein